MEKYIYAYIHNVCKPPHKHKCKGKNHKPPKKKIDIVDNPKSNALHGIATVTRETNDQGEMTMDCQKANALHFQNACKNMEKK